jgi:hypothetical protein
MGCAQWVKVARAALVLVAAGCTGGGGKDDDSAAAVDSAGGGADGAGDGAADGGDGVDPGTFPEGPIAFTLTATGAADLNLSFSAPDCPYRVGGTSFRQTWRGEGHVYVLIVEVSRDFPGTAGTYAAAGQARVRLQEEAGGSLAYYDSALGDAEVSVTFDGFDVDASQAWGSFSAGALGDSAGGRLEIGPQPLPIWCPSLL